ncbi:DUF4139 domain-containing protein [Patescibacteria group bacterium]
MAKKKNSKKFPHLLIYLKLLMAVIVFVGAVAGTYYWKKYDQNDTEDLKLDDAIEFSSKIDSERSPEDFIGAMAADVSSVDKDSVELTVYNRDLALVKEVRELELEKGFTQVSYSDVPEFINPSSVIFKDLKNANTEVVEQNYEYDLVNINKLMNRYLGEEISVTIDEGDGVKEISGKLLSHSDGGNILVESDDGVTYAGYPNSIDFSLLPQDLLIKPTLMWSIWAEVAGSRDVQTSYLTNGITWSADYVAQVNADDSKIDLKGWTTINNRSGADYPNAKLKLVAGDVNIVEQDYKRQDVYYEEEMAMPMAAPTAGGFAEESFFEYHLYSLSRKTNLLDKQEKQISLLNAKNVEVDKQFIFDDWKDGENVRVELVMENKESKGLGMPLPKGIVRVYKADSEGQSQFLGEDNIDHTPKDEEVRIYVGNAFDIVVEKTITESKSAGGFLDFGGSCTVEDIEVEVRNHKDEDVVVYVFQNSWGRNVEIKDASHDYEEEDAATFKFKVPVDKDDETTLKYSFKECW